ncbi:hypothetical protein E2C01_100274 [Portunus trituberculatus]|uniref:Uncharacterized protein n=1 Tax=Portunus trituberculatus TaxID=210409 RepID=A0A5B7KBL5_PORTR|nr:hypothetical protein [Portunus trituberculatus]
MGLRSNLYRGDVSIRRVPPSPLQRYSEARPWLLTGRSSSSLLLFTKAEGRLPLEEEEENKEKEDEEEATGASSE